MLKRAPRILGGVFRGFALTVARWVPPPVKRFVHRSRLLDGWTRSAFARLVGFDGTEARIEEGPMRGLRLAVSAHVSHAHIAGSYERETQDALDELLKPGMVCYDLGASIGYFSLLMARRARIVYAFEPAPHAAAELERQARTNGFAHIRPVRSPVSDARGPVTFALTDVAYGSSIVEGSSRWPTLTLEATTLDEFVAEHEPPDLIKIDVEGAEGRVLRGGQTVLERCRPIICCELHSETAAQEVLAVLKPLGYAIRNLDGTDFCLDGPITAGLVQVVARAGATS